MVYQTLKFFLVRTGLSIFLMMTLGFGALYFFHEIALPHAKLDDTVVQGLLGFVCLFLGFFSYGLFGDHLLDSSWPVVVRVAAQCDAVVVIELHQLVRTRTDRLVAERVGSLDHGSIKEVLGQMGLHLGMEFPDWPPENIEELAQLMEDPY